MMFQALQLMQKQMADQNQVMQEQLKQMEAKTEAQVQIIAEKVGGNRDGNQPGAGGIKSRAKGRHPEKLERDVDYAPFFNGKNYGNCMLIVINCIH